jgi:hypothetical protein
MIKSMQWEVMSNGRGSEPLWFHPRACRVPGAVHDSVFMTAQGISGSDYFHPVNWMQTDDSGKTWSEPTPVPGFDRHDYPDSDEFGTGVQEGVCDVVPEYHAQTGTVLCMGHTVFYRDGSFFLPQPDRRPAYNVYDPKTGAWSGVHRLEWSRSDEYSIYTAGCAQRHTFENGEILLPMSFRRKGDTAAQVTTARLTYDGETCTIVETGSVLTLDVKRGLLEPSVVEWNGRYFLTIRAEDDRGYCAVADDGLNWSSFEPWCWDDGTPLTMSTTQSRWLPHSDALYLVYTRRDESNRNVMRWRAPLYVAEVDTETMRLIRDSEQVAVPLRGDGVDDPDFVARLGNFHTVEAAADESWVTVGECIPKDDWKGDTIISRIAWSGPNARVK